MLQCNALQSCIWVKCKDLKITVYQKAYLPDRRLALRLAWASSIRCHGPSQGSAGLRPRTRRTSPWYGSERFSPSTPCTVLSSTGQSSLQRAAAALYSVSRSSQRILCETQHIRLTLGSLSKSCLSHQSVTLPATIPSTPGRTHIPSPWASCDQNVLLFTRAFSRLSD